MFECSELKIKIDDFREEPCQRPLLCISEGDMVPIDFITSINV